MNIDKNLSMALAETVPAMSSPSSFRRTVNKEYVRARMCLLSSEMAGNDEFLPILRKAEEQMVIFENYPRANEFLDDLLVSLTSKKELNFKPKLQSFLTPCDHINHRRLGGKCEKCQMVFYRALKGSQQNFSQRIDFKKL